LKFIFKGSVFKDDKSGIRFYGLRFRVHGFRVKGIGFKIAG
jgi:hypothetical protein